MEGLFLYTNIDINKQTSGEAKKVEMQVAALRSSGVDVKVVNVERNKKYNKIKIRMPFLPVYKKTDFIKLQQHKIKDMKFIYIRKYIIDYSFLKTLKKIKKLNPTIKIILEIPTYPYDLEWSRIIDKPLLIKEKINRKKLYKYVDKIVTFSKDSSIFRIPTIKINNGIDVNRISVINKSESTNENTINLVGVALLAKWHGYDRLIRGIFDYYSTNKAKVAVNFYIVGEGSELKNLKELVKRYSLEKYVFFSGKLSGESLDEMYNISDIAVGSLGMHRIGLLNGYTLKLREYCAKGIPFIKGYDDEVFDSSFFQYMKSFPNNDTPIDINEIISFYENCVKDKEVVAKNMREFAINNLTWEKQMSQVTEYVKQI